MNVLLAILVALALGASPADGYGHGTTTTTTTPKYTTTTAPTTTTTLPQCPEEPCGTNPNTVPTTTTTTTTTTAPTTTTTVAPTTTGTAATTTTVVPTTLSPTTTTTPATTSTSTTTTSTLPATFDFAGAASICVREVPTIRITFANALPQLAGVTGTLTMRDINGNVVSTQPLVYQPGAVVDLLYPGTSVNPDGSIDDVPGWILTDDGFWIRDASDEFLREGISLTYTVNPTATAFVTYPPESSACANPDGPFPPPSATPPAVPRLPATR